MKRLIYLFAVIAILAACSSEKKGFVITGTVEGAVDGDTVYLQSGEGRQLTKQDSAIITNGIFTFKGVQDTVVDRLITYNAAGKTPLMMTFFLENGNIDLRLTKYSDSSTGTQNNDTYQEVRDQLNQLTGQMIALDQSMPDSTLTDEQRKTKDEEMNALNEKYFEVQKASIAKNIKNIVGIYMLKQLYYYLTLDDMAPLIPLITPEYQNDKTIVFIKEKVDKMKKTAIGQKFTDFEMLTPDGELIKLSDYAGKGKVVLIDFWASWCGPCLREMPNLVDAYAKYKDKNFEIVGVSLDESNDDWIESIKKLNIIWPQMSDLKYWNNKGAQLYAINSIPHTVLIDGEGTIIAHGLHGDGLQEKLAEILKK